jgi:SIR2-like domain
VEAEAAESSEAAATGDTLSAVDAVLRLAVAVYHGKGAYALLLGSGVSKSANIPTGWEIVLDLIRQLAAAREDQCERGQEVDWYSRTFNASPTYDALLNQVTSFKAERAQVLSNYIEPTDQEVRDGAKVPQIAHRAIARLVRDGYIRVIVTTNFDQLLEQALREVNVTPRVITTPEAVEQALPLVHQECTIIKVHGDYTSGELKNTSEELAEYDERLNRLLGRVFSDFGLIICGWSAEWDKALRAVISVNTSRAYSTFWTAREALGENAKQALARREGKALIMIESADSFFQTLEEKVHAIRQVLESPTLTPDVARAIVERYLEDPYTNRIRITNLVQSEIESALAWLDHHVYLPQSPIPPDEFKREMSQLMTAVGPTIAMLAACGRWGGSEQHHILTGSFQRVLDASQSRGFDLRWRGYWAYTAYLMLYGAGIAAVSGERYDNLLALLASNVREFDGRERVPALWALSDNAYRQLGEEINRIRPRPGEYSPLSNQLHEDLRQSLALLIPDDARYDELFDRFECLLALLFVDEDLHLGKRGEWAPSGRFSWQNRLHPEQNVTSTFESEVTAQQGAWPPLQAGLFDGDLQRVRVARAHLDRFLVAIQSSRT